MLDNVISDITIVIIIVVVIIIIIVIIIIVVIITTIIILIIIIVIIVIIIIIIIINTITNFISARFAPSSLSRRTRRCCNTANCVRMSSIDDACDWASCNGDGGE